MPTLGRLFFESALYSVQSFCDIISLMLMYKEQYYLTIAVAVIGILAGLINPEGLAWIAAPISIIWLVGMFAIKIYKEKFKK